MDSVKKHTKEISEKESIKKFITSNGLQLTVQIVGLLMVVVNLYLAAQLSPLVQDIAIVNKRVDAIEKRNEQIDPLIPRFYQLEERDKQLIIDITKIKEDIEKIKIKLLGGGNYEPGS